MKILIILALCAISISIPSAYAYYTPDQPNTLFTYNSTSTDILLKWDFNSLSSTDRCGFKGDINFFNFDDTNNTKTHGYIPVNYSPFSANATILNSTTNPVRFAEEIPCTGNVTMNLDDIFEDRLVSPEINTSNFTNSDMYFSFYILQNGTFDPHDIFLLDEVQVYPFGNYETTQADIDNACFGEIGNSLFINPTGLYWGNDEPCNNNDSDMYVPLDDNVECCDFPYIENLSITDTITIQKITNEEPIEDPVVDPVEDPIIIETPPEKPRIVESGSSGVTVFELKNWVNSKENFGVAINHMIITGMIDTKKISSHSNPPEWVIGVAELWKSNEITDKEYHHMIEYLIENNIIN